MSKKKSKNDLRIASKGASATGHLGLFLKLLFRLVLFFKDFLLRTVGTKFNEVSTKPTDSPWPCFYLLCLFRSNVSFSI